jgi:hypothetical protein
MANRIENERAKALTKLSTELANPSPLFFGYDIADLLSEKLDEALADHPADKVFLVADKVVHAVHGELMRTLLEWRPDTELLLIEPGEASKSWAGLESLCEQLMSRGASKRNELRRCRRCLICRFRAPQAPLGRMGRMGQPWKHPPSSKKSASEKSAKILLTIFPPENSPRRFQGNKTLSLRHH